MRRLLVIEDGDEYTVFAHALLGEIAHAESARDGRQALDKAGAADVFLVDLRFNRADPAALLGDVEVVARDLFGGDRTRAARHLQDQQGLYILRALRVAGHAQRAIFVHDFSPRRLANLRALYGDVAAVPGFDAQLLAHLVAEGA